MSLADIAPSLPTMPVILAIQTDQQQIKQLTSIVHGLGAELVLAESADRAITVLGQRVPDVILTPPLLSPKDDVALTARLRELGNAAVHVQMLSIPILAIPGGAPSRGRLSILRRAQEESVGCAPDVFGGQLVEYLERAAIERKRAAAIVQRPPVIAPADQEGQAAGDVGEQAAVESATEQFAFEETSPGVADSPSLDLVLADDRRAADEAVRIATELRIAEEQRAAKAAADAKAAEERRAAAEAAAAAAEAKAQSQQRAIAEALRAAADARAAEEQRAAKAAAEAARAEERIAAAEQARAAAEARALDAQRGADEAVRAAIEARTVEEKRIAKAVAEATKDRKSVM